MYDWRIFCNREARRYASERGLEIESKDYGHLEHFHYGGEGVCEDVVQSLRLEPTDRVLDAGCAIGGSARTLSRLNLNVVGVDANAEFIQFAESISDQRDIFKHSRLEDSDGLQYDAWYALLLFVHIRDRDFLFNKLENDCSKSERFFIETIVSNSKRHFFETPPWTDREIDRLIPSASVTCQTATWTRWTQLRLERFLKRRLFFEDLYGCDVVEKRIVHYDNIAEGFQAGALLGRRIIGEQSLPPSEIETDFDKICIIEFDQLLDIK